MKDDILWLQASDLKNWTFCKRCVFYRFHAGAKPPRTPSMELGLALDRDRLELEKRLAGKKYRIAVAGREAKPRLRDPVHCIAGVPDMVLRDARGLEYPVEFKKRARGAGNGPSFQALVYGFLLHETGRRVGPFGFVYGIDDRALMRVPLTGARFEVVRRTASRVRQCVTEESLPPPTPHREKCAACEWLRFCNDVY